MFKTATILRINAEPPELHAMREAMAAYVFAPCGPTQPSSAGWVPPRGEKHAELLESIGGHWIACLQLEQRMLPSPVVKRRVQEMADKLEEQTGRKPRGKVLRELKDEAVLELLPQAFTKQARILVWIDPAAGLIVVDTASSAKADIVAASLVAAAPRTNLHPLHTALAPATAMAIWLQNGEAPPDFSIDRECELKEPDGDKAVVRYARHTLDIEEVREHIAHGKLPTQLAMTYADRVSFTLTEDGTLKGIDVLEVALEMAATEDDAASGFDADVAIATGELSKLIAAVVDALGGAVMLPIEDAAKAPAEETAEAAS